MHKELEGYSVNLSYKGPYDNKENVPAKEKPLCNDDEGQVGFDIKLVFFVTLTLRIYETL
jgi:hypothetical protein